MQSKPFLHQPAELLSHHNEVISSEVVNGNTTKLRLLKRVDANVNTLQVTSVSVVPFIQPGTLVATILARGIDIPGGHVNPEDSGVTQTLRREAYEEACILLAKPLYLIGIIESDYNPQLTTHMLIFVGQVSRMDDFSANYEATGREIVSASAFLRRYKAGPSQIMTEIMNRAVPLSKLLYSHTDS